MEDKIFGKTFECLNCYGNYYMKDMAYRWYLPQGQKGLCTKCNAEFIRKGVNDVDKFLQTRYKTYTEEFKFYFRVWNYMWSKERMLYYWGYNHSILEQEEPEINYPLCLIWEQKLYFRNWGAELQIYLHQNQVKIKKELLKLQQKVLQVYSIYQMSR